MAVKERLHELKKELGENFTLEFIATFNEHFHYIVKNFIQEPNSSNDNLKKFIHQIKSSVQNIGFQDKDDFFKNAEYLVQEEIDWILIKEEVKTIHSFISSEIESWLETSS